MSRKLLKQSTIYSLNHLFTTLSGLITFPLLTKNLSVVEYGAAGLFTITIGMLSSFNKFGLQQSIIRFKPDLTKDELQSNIFYPCLFLILMSSSFIYCLGLFLSDYSDSLLFTSPAMMIVIASSCLQSIRALTENILIADQRSVLLTVFSLIYRVLTLSTVAIIILYVNNSAIGFIYSILLADIVLTVIILGWCYQKNILTSFKVKHLNMGLITASLAFSIPMFGNEIAHMLHAFIDRYFIEYFISREALGIYSASYNMANIISSTLVGGLSIALVPIYLSTWKEQGLEATRKLLSDVNRIYLLLSPGIIAGLYLVSEPLLIILATSEYAEFSYLLPVISSGIFLFSTNVIYAAGLQIEKKPKKLFQFVLESAGINILFNYIFIPIYGIKAAAFITVISYLWMTVRMYREGRKVIDIGFDYKLFIRSIVYSLVMIEIVSLVEVESKLVYLILCVLLGAFIYSSLILLVERNVRGFVFSILKNKTV